MVRCWGVLDFGAISGALPSVGGMLGVLWMRVMETHEGMLNVTRHGEIDSVLGIIPLEGEATIPGGGPIFSDLVMFMEGVEEVVGIILFGIMNGKVIDN